MLVDGRIEVDEEACKSEGIPAARVTRTIEILNLNAKRLRAAREKHWKALEKELGKIEKELGKIDELGDSDMVNKVNNWMRSVLMPNDAGRLVAFFTTTRSYFGTFSPLAERVLAQQPQGWI